MTILLATLAVAFAAFCVWLTVRIVNLREKYGKAFWAMLILAVLLIGYPLSFAPAVHLCGHGLISFDAVVATYRPIRGPLHAAVKNGHRRRHVALGNERVMILMEQIVAYLYND